MPADQVLWAVFGFLLADVRAIAVHPLGVAEHTASAHAGAGLIARFAGGLAGRFTRDAPILWNELRCLDEDLTDLSFRAFALSCAVLQRPFHRDAHPRPSGGFLHLLLSPESDTDAEVAFGTVPVVGAVGCAGTFGEGVRVSAKAEE